jgi:hypothetical protein
MLENLESFLYNEKPALLDNPQLEDECGQWTKLFPHLRFITLLIYKDCVASKCSQKRNADINMCLLRM